MRMRRIILSPVDCPVCYIFPQYLTNGTILDIKWVFQFYLQLFLSETFLILRRTDRDITTNVHRSASCTVPLVLSDFNDNFFGHIIGKYSNIKFDENPSSDSQVVPCWPTDRQTDRYNKASLIVAFRNLANAPGKQIGAENIQNW